MENNTNIKTVNAPTSRIIKVLDNPRSEKPEWATHSSIFQRGLSFVLVKDKKIVDWEYTGPCQFQTDRFYWIGVKGEGVLKVEDENFLDLFDYNEQKLAESGESKDILETLLAIGVEDKFLEKAKRAEKIRMRLEYEARENHRAKTIEWFLKEHPQFKSRVEPLNREDKRKLVKSIDFLCRGGAWETFEEILKIPTENFVRPNSGELFEAHYGFKWASMPRCWEAIGLREFLTGETARELTRKNKRKLEKNRPSEIWHVGAEKLQSIEIPELDA